MIDEIEPSLARKKFIGRMRQQGKNKLKVYVFSGDGQLESSFPQEFMVLEKLK